MINFCQRFNLLFAIHENQLEKLIVRLYSIMPYTIIF